MFFSRKNQVDNRVFSLAPSYYLHPYSDMQFIPFIESQYIYLALMLFSAKSYALKLIIHIKKQESWTNLHIIVTL